MSVQLLHRKAVMAIRCSQNSWGTTNDDDYQGGDDDDDDDDDDDIVS